MIYHLLRRFYEVNRFAPERLYFYRDGVSEGQFKELLQEEVGGGSSSLSVDRGSSDTDRGGRW